MKSISKLKDDARKHEQREEWEKAIHVYLQAIRVGDAADDDGEVELPLFNRVGDLYVRLGREAEAVIYYEQAADRYAGAGFYNNAIALCNKALRHAPDRLALLRKLGHFSASQGFITDARRYFLEYAEREFKAGAADKALTALEDFANLSDDPEIRELLARRLHTHGRTGEAVAEFRRAYAMRVENGELQEAAALRQELQRIAPDQALLPDDPVESVGTGETGDTDEMAAPADEPQFGDVLLAGVDTGEMGLDDVAFEIITPGESAPLEGLETTSLEDFDTADSSLLGDIEIEGFDDTAGDIGFDTGDRFDIGVGDEAESDADDEREFRTVVGGLEGLDTGTVDFDAEDLLPPDPDLGIEPDMEFGGFDLPTLDDDEPDTRAEPFPLDQDDVGDFDLPTLDSPFAEDQVSPDSHEPVHHDVAPIDLGSFDIETADFDSFELPTLPEADETPVADFDAPTDAEPTSEDDPDSTPDISGFAATPEFAAGAEPELSVEPDLSVEPELSVEPASSVEPAAESQPAADADLMSDTSYAAEPDVPAGYAPEAGLEPEPAPEAQEPTPEREPAPAGEDYFDLGTFLVDDVEEETRFRIEETAPTGDEERDFAELLSQFRSKIADHVPTEDAAAHYDLGLAFKEMGLIDEAIAEFQIALRDGLMKLKVYEELGGCFLQKENFNIAEKVLRRALELKYSDELELLGVYYHLGRAYEGLGDRDRARDAYERVLGMDINFQDVTERLLAL